jgi:hypothetical protein
MEKGAGRMIRTVRVFGADGEPQMMVQKIGHAVFPQQDKLVRNMMGIPMEIKFGNRLSFPACGFSIDAWVLALREVNAYIPLARLGPGHESWGMSSRGGLPVVTDQAKQHVTYAEAGSFGDHLLRTYGIAKLKAFNSLSRSGTRPWLEVFKLPLDALEQDWNQALQKREAKDVPLLVRLLKQNPSDACSEARRIAQ